MNGNTPYAGLPDVTQAGHRAAADVPDLSAATRRALQRDAASVANRTRDLLPTEYVVDSMIAQGIGGPAVTIAVYPPIGHTVSAEFTPTIENVSDGVIDVDEQVEVAHGLAASAALQVKQIVDNDDEITPTAK